MNRLINNSEIVPLPTFLYNVSRSLLNQPLMPFVQTRMKPLGTVDMDVDILCYGDETTYYFMRGLKLPYGISNGSTDKLLPNWKWSFNISKMVLTVTDQTGEIIATRPIKCWTDLNVSYEILKSHQFIYVIDAEAKSNTFIIAAREMSNREDLTENSAISWITTTPDWNNGGGKSSYDKKPYLANQNAIPIHIFRDIEIYEKYPECRIAIQSIISHYFSTGEFDEHVMVLGVPPIVAKKILIIKPAVIRLASQILFILALSTSILDGGNLPYIEPWLIWGIWKWLPRLSDTLLSDKIFDLSPWWE